jgi:alpha-N-arabinofuranosidase
MHADFTQPRIEILAGEKAKTPVSRMLYGKFTEHLGANVYNGAWAQILRNTGFEPGDYFGRPHATYPQIEGVAFTWESYGKGDVTYSLSTDHINSDTSQSIEVRKLDSPEVGIRQKVFLPLHRTNKFELSLWVKGSPSDLYIAVQTLQGRELGSTSLTGISGKWKRHNAKLDLNTIGISKGQELVFTVGAREPGTILLDQCFLFPADAMRGLDPDVIKMMREAQLPLLRFPGGNFVSGYHWQDGIGPIDQRPIKKNPAWPGDEPNHVGTDEWMACCELVGCEALICVNAGNGTPKEAADWVEYCNGGPNTKFGALRTKNGHPKPYGVRYWEIGNELYGDWQIGHCTAEEYAKRYRQFHDAMEARDPSILFIANGQDPEWNEPTIREDADILRSLSIHCLMGNQIPADSPPEAVFRSYMALPVWFEDYLRGMGDQMAKGGVKDPKLALTELQVFIKHDGQPTNQTLAEALMYAGMLNAAIRLDALLEMITHSALINHGAGLLKQRELVFANPLYLAEKIYSTQSGKWPVHIEVTSPQFSVHQLVDMPGVENAPYLDAVALLDDSSKELNLLVTNRHPKDTLATEIALDGFKAEPEIATQTLAGNYMARNSFERPDAVRIRAGKTRGESGGLTYKFPASSLTCLHFKSVG